MAATGKQNVGRGTAHFSTPAPLSKCHPNLNEDVCACGLRMMANAVTFGCGDAHVNNRINTDSTICNSTISFEMSGEGGWFQTTLCML